MGTSIREILSSRPLSAVERMMFQGHEPFVEQAEVLIKLSQPLLADDVEAHSVDGDSDPKPKAKNIEPEECTEHIPTRHHGLLPTPLPTVPIFDASGLRARRPLHRSGRC
jgi:hypothetical protein